MKRTFGNCLLASLFAIVFMGCEPRPVVVDPDDGDTTIIEDDADVEVVPNGTTTQPETGVDVRVGGGEGVDVDVNPPTTGSNASGSSTDPGQSNNPNAQQ